MDMMFGRDPFGPMCNACRQPIGNEPAVRIEFATDPHGHLGLSGDYHAACGKPFQSLARIVNFNPWGRF